MITVRAINHRLRLCVGRKIARRPDGVPIDRGGWEDWRSQTAWEAARAVNRNANKKEASCQ